MPKSNFAKKVDAESDSTLGIKWLNVACGTSKYVLNYFIRGFKQKKEKKTNISPKI